MGKLLDAYNNDQFEARRPCSIRVLLEHPEHGADFAAALGNPDLVIAKLVRACELLDIDIAMNQLYKHQAGGCSCG